jgi:hypothetical protein
VFANQFYDLHLFISYRVVAQGIKLPSNNKQGIKLPQNKEPRASEGGLAGQFLVVCSRLQINNFKIRQTSAEVEICRSLALTS